MIWVSVTCLTGLHPNSFIVSHFLDKRIAELELIRFCIEMACHLYHSSQSPTPTS